ncbi:MAG: exodeoxyribonuclease V subunit gamma, partial [Candidatus Electrothrix sp. AR4]|nr:exodeoxyribonuclease V subunit gamma [Candidatus Electrothrix sp. AR4]
MYLYQSNRLENLFSALCATLAEPIANPLAPEVIVVQNPGMSRWLSQQIALRTGISAHLSFPLPATFVWNIFEQTLGILPDLSQFDRNVLLWRIQQELTLLLTDPSMREINAYLQDDFVGSKKFQLAEKITDIFDQYLVYRSEMLLEWEKGEVAEGKGGENLWQAKLWQQLTNKNKNHRAALMRQFIQIARAGMLRADTLPQRVSIFGINSLAPAYLEVIDQISRHIDIHIFHLSPCRQAWDDILPERLLAIKRQSWRDQGIDDVSEYFTAGNPLLASMGTVGQEFFSQLMQLNPIDTDLYEEPVASRPLSTLGAIQWDILDLRDRSYLGDQENCSQQQNTQILFGDNSIRFHCCHSSMREIQVLHDRLLDLFTADPELNPTDILVMAPDISLYAPAVGGVFGSAPTDLRIPWSIADRSVQ